MLELQDIQKLFAVLPTKTDFDALRTDFDELRKDVSEMKITLNNLVTITDGLVGRMESLHQEYLVLRERDTRFERWIHEIAEKVGITLTP